MREYVSLRDVRLASTAGHCVYLQARVPRPIPPELEALAVEKGCIPADGGLPGDDDKTPDELDAEARAAALEAACAEILAANNENLLTMDGVPRQNVVKSRLTPRFDFNVDELAEAWSKVTRAAGAPTSLDDDN